MVEPRSKEELALMRKSGEISAKALKKAIQSAEVGVNLLELDRAVTQEILDLGGEISFTTVDRYRWATCLTVNDEVVHGIPRKEIVLKSGDILGIDLGTLYKGWHTDTAWSVVVGNEPNTFLKIGERTLWQAIDKAVEGNRIGDISEVIQKGIEGGGYSVVRTLIGHGVGKELHEDPEVPGIGKAGTGMLLKAGMTLAIEAIYTAGDGEVELAKDGWTYISSDGSMGGLFEMTVIVGEKAPEVLTDWRSV